MVSLQFLSSHALSLSPFKPHNSSCCSVGIFLHYPFFCRKTFPYRPLPTGWITFILFHWKFVFMFIGVLFYCIARYFVLSLPWRTKCFHRNWPPSERTWCVCVTLTVHKTFFTGQNQVGNKKIEEYPNDVNLQCINGAFREWKDFLGGGAREILSACQSSIRYDPFGIFFQLNWRKSNLITHLFLFLLFQFQVCRQMTSNMLCVSNPVPLRYGTPHKTNI